MTRALKQTAAFIVLIFFFAPTASGQETEWHQESGYRWTSLPAVPQGPPGFTRLSPEQTRISFTNFLSEVSIATNRVLANGSGVAVGDFDNDGWPDLFFCGLESPNVLYRNLGNWKFQDVTLASGLGTEQSSRGAVFADINGDGYLDLLVSTVNHGVRCYLNQRNGKFIETTQAAGTASTFGSTTMALADVDGNGTLDLYVTNYRPDDMRDRGRLTLPAIKGKPTIPLSEKNHLTLRNGQVFEYGQPDQLFLNDGTGQFHPVPWNDGTFLDEMGQKLPGPPLDWGLTATFRDVNGDGAPDLYVCNDYWTPDRFWINDGHGHFRAIAPLALRKTSSSSMGVDFADLDRDGLLDFFVVDMLSDNPQVRKRQALADKSEPSMIGAIDDRPQVMRNTLFRNRGDGTYAEIANFARLAGSDWSWSPLFLDVDLDGYEDLLISAGHFRDVQDLDAQAQIRARQHPWSGYKNDADRQSAYTAELMQNYRLYPPLDLPIKSFRNAHAFHFEETTESWGLNDLAVHHGLAVGDFDRDGDLDVVVNNLNGLAGIYRNNASAGRVAVRLKGIAPNTQGIGARVALLHGAVERQSTEIIAGGRYLSGSEPLSVFATDSAAGNLTLEVRWRSGRTQVISDVKPARLYEIDEIAAGRADPEIKPQPVVLFEDRSDSLKHIHSETPFDDFQRQPLLPFKLSQSGPGDSWFDIDGDGHDDLLIGSGDGSPPAVYKSDGRGTFTPVEVSPNPLATSQHSALLGLNDFEGKPFFLAGLTGYENASSNGLSQFAFGDGKITSDSGAPAIATASALALGLDDRGVGLVLFVGGGVWPGRYPLGKPSKIFRYNGHQWSADLENSAFLGNLGIVNSAVWTDLNGDGIPELVAASEWGSIHVFRWRGRRLFEFTDEYGLSKLTGFWKGVTAGDFDGDGRMDLIAANWGLNNSYLATAERPLTLFYGEMAQPGVLDVVETEWDPGRGELTPIRSIADLSASLPFIREQFASQRQYSQASLREVLGERMPLARKLEVNTLESMVFLNRGTHFEPVKLPDEAQWAPAFSVNVADFDGDGREDVFLSQNFFATRAEVPRLDAGRGLLLHGDGAGKFTPVSGADSGLLIYGEQRGAAICDFNEDGRPDLVVSQNGAATKLYQNVSERAGLRVKLKGPAQNPHGIGAIIRLMFGEHLGPAREIHAGSGYWSQDSSTQILGSIEKPTAVWIRWPGGKTSTTEIPPNSHQVTIGLDGNLVVGP